MLPTAFRPIPRLLDRASRRIVAACRSALVFTVVVVVSVVVPMPAAV